MSFGPTGIYTHDGTSAASLRIATASQESSLRNRIVASFATTTARDAAYAGLTSSQKEGILCWVVNRAGHSYWSPQDNTWKWVSVARVIANQDQGTSGIGAGVGNVTVSHGAGYGSVQGITATTLPPGNRLIRVEYSCVVTNSGVGTGYTLPRVSVSGTGMGAVGSSNTWIAGYLPDLSAVPLTLSRSWQYILAGSIDVDVSATNSALTNRELSITYGRLDITDLGPA